MDDRRKVKQEKKISDHPSQQIQRLSAESETKCRFSDKYEEMGSFLVPIRDRPKCNYVRLSVTLRMRWDIGRPV